MSQEDIYKIIKANPGIEQRDIHKVLGTRKQNVSEFVLRLARNGRIRREINKKGTWTYKLWVIE